MQEHLLERREAGEKKRRRAWQHNAGITAGLFTFVHIVHFTVCSGACNGRSALTHRWRRGGALSRRSMPPTPFNTVFNAVSI